MSSAYDHVLLDSPPLVPVTDARILAASCEATVVALRADRSTRKAAVYARDMLQSVGATLLGVVVNDVPRRRARYGDYYGDGYVYQHGYGPPRRDSCAVERANGANGANGAGASGASIDTSSATTTKA